MDRARKSLGLEALTYAIPRCSLGLRHAHSSQHNTSRGIMRRIVLVLAPVLGLALSAADGSAQVARRPFLFKDGRGELAAARARGERDVTVIMAAMPGANAQLAAT